MLGSAKKARGCPGNPSILSSLAGMLAGVANRMTIRSLRRSVYLRQQSSPVAHTSLLSVLRQMLLGVFAVGLLSTSACAENRMYCYQKVLETGATGGGEIRVNGFTVEVKPTAGGVSEDMTCHATVTSPQGRIVYEKDDWGMEIDPITGKDVNGDGQPDAVLVSFSGGAHCCWSYHIISLGENPGLIREFENRSNASFRDIRGDGQIEILIRDGSFDFAFGLDHAFSVFPLLIVQLKGKEFVDVGSRFWPVFAKEIRQEHSKISNQQLQEFLHSDTDEIHDSLDYLRTKSAILMTVLDYLYAGRSEEARKSLGKQWPPNSQQKIWEQMTSGYCTGLRAHLELESSASCGE
jgi:hypothetical protein